MPALVGGGLSQVQVLVASLAAQQQARQQEGQGCTRLALHQPGKQGLKAAGVCMRHLCHEAAPRVNILSVTNRGFLFLVQVSVDRCCSKEAWMVVMQEIVAHTFAMF